MSSTMSTMSSTIDPEAPPPSIKPAAVPANPEHCTTLADDPATQVMCACGKLRDFRLPCGAPVPSSPP
jgi:hypothetical protein